MAIVVFSESGRNYKIAASEGLPGRSLYSGVSFAQNSSVYVLVNDGGGDLWDRRTSQLESDLPGIRYPKLFSEKGQIQRPGRGGTPCATVRRHSDAARRTKTASGTVAVQSRGRVLLQDLKQGLGMQRKFSS